jgi:hypothetical protein
MADEPVVFLFIENVEFHNCFLRWDDSVTGGSGFPYCRYFFGTDSTDFAVFGLVLLIPVKYSGIAEFVNSCNGGCF